MPQLPSPAHARSTWIVVLALGLALIAAYANSFRVPFLFDDASSILENPTLRDWRTALFPPRDSGLTVSGRPLLNLSFAIDRALHDGRVAGYHATNLFIHWLAALTLFGLIRRTCRLEAAPAGIAARNANNFALIVSLLWALHPLQTESVTYIVQRAESLVGLCYLFTLYAFVRSLQSENHHRLWQTLSVAACIAGMAAKEVMVSAPLIALLYDRAFVAKSFREAWRARRGFYLALASGWLVLAACIVASGGRGGTVGLAGDISVADYFLTQCHAITHYLRLAMWPAPLVFDYGANVVGGFGEVAGRFFLLAALAGITGYALWKWPRAGFLATAFFALLAPTSSFVPVITQTMAEHRMYLALAPLLALLAAGASRKNGFPFLCGGLALALAWGVVTHLRNRDYRSARSIWEDTLAKAPDNVRAYASLGTLLAEAGDFAAAERRLGEALRISPNDSGALVAYGNVLIALGRRQEGYDHYERALALRPGYHDALYNYGKGLLDEGRMPEAIVRLQQAVDANPSAANARYNLGNAYLAAGWHSYSIYEYDSVIRNDPASIDALNNRGIALGALGNQEAAILDYRQALRHAPGDPRTLINLGRTLASLGRQAEALDCFRQAADTGSDLPQAHANLGLALAEAGRDAEAITPSRRALDLGLDDPALHTRLGLSLLKLEHIDEASRELAAVVARHPDFIDARYTYANLLLQSGRPDEAVDHYIALRRLAPHSAEIANNLGIAFAQLGRMEDARSAFADALSLDPSFSQARENLRQASE